MTNKNIHIKPCTVHWNTMNETEKGKACGFCEKEVIDFTNSSNEEILNVLAGKDNVCGRLNSIQLASIDTDFIKPFNTSSSIWKRASLFLLAFIGLKGFMGKGVAQAIKKEDKNNSVFCEINKQSKVINFRGRISNQISPSTEITLYVNNNLLCKAISDSLGFFDMKFVIDTTNNNMLELNFYSENKYSKKSLSSDSLKDMTLLKLEWLDDGINIKNARDDSDNLIILGMLTPHNESIIIKSNDEEVEENTQLKNIIGNDLSGTPASEGGGVMGEEKKEEEW